MTCFGVFFDLLFKGMTHVAQHLHCRSNIGRRLLHFNLILGTTGGAADSLGELFHFIELLDVFLIQRVLFLKRSNDRRTLTLRGHGLDRGCPDIPSLQI